MAPREQMTYHNTTNNNKNIVLVCMTVDIKHFGHISICSLMEKEMCSLTEKWAAMAKHVRTAVCKSCLRLSVALARAKFTGIQCDCCWWWWITEWKRQIWRCGWPTAVTFNQIWNGRPLSAQQLLCRRYSVQSPHWNCCNYSDCCVNSILINVITTEEEDNVHCARSSDNALLLLHSSQTDLYEGRVLYALHRTWSSQMGIGHLFWLNAGRRNFLSCFICPLQCRI